MYNQKSKKLVLGEGETIGHKHVLESDSNIEYAMLDDCIAFSINGTGVITHDEHDRIVFEAGKHRSYHQVEFNPLDRKVSRIFD